jgi:hypothetical protein
VFTSFSGSQVRQLADGGAIAFAQLPETKQDQLITGVESVIAEPYRQWKASLPESATVVVWIAPEFFLTLKGDDFGSQKTLTLPLSKLVVGLKPAPVLKEGAGTPVNPFPDPPSLSDVMAQAPTDPQARPAWLRGKAFELLAPIGAEWLSRAGVPFPYPLFAQPSDVAIKDLSADQVSWLKALYTRYAADTYAKQQLLRKHIKFQKKSGRPVQPNVTVLDATTGVTVQAGEVPDYALPFWDQFADKTVVSMSVRYLPVIQAPSAGVCTQGLGWCLK